jgi:flagellar biosynthesis GTPase FlhF
LEAISLEIDELNNKNVSLSDSVNKYNVKVLELKSNSKVSGEIGPLKYISKLTGIPMANVVNYMILLLIFVFDPLAVALILAASKIFEIEKENKKDDKKEESNKEEVKIEEESELEVVEDEINTEEENIINIENTTPEKKEEVQKENFEDFVQKKKKKLEEDRKIFLPLLKSFYKEGDIKAGNIMLTYPEFNELVKNSGYSDDNIKMFLTLCNYLEITELSDNIRKSKVDYEEAKNMMNKYLSLEEKDIVEEIIKEEEKIEPTNENLKQESKDWWNKK